MAPAPLYAFQLPPPLIADFEPRQLHIPTSHPLHPSNQQAAIAAGSPTPTEPASTQLAIAGAFNCALTGASFPDLAALKDHYKTDWYKYNVKLRMQGKPTGVTEEQFTALVEGLSDSLSGSDSSSDSDPGASSSSSTNAVSRLLRKQQLDRPAAARDDDEMDPLEALEGPRSALMWFEAANVNPGTQYGVYRAALPVAGGGKKRIDGGELLKELKALQLPEQQPKGAPQGKERKWTLLMFGGGHFAGMVVSLVPKLVSKGKGKEKEKEVVVLEKKTFHRYTTRRKQGGSQGANDNANGKAKSAGAQIRRHNEMALTDEVRDLLGSWKEQIDDSELVFLRCSKSNYKTFFQYDDAVLDRKDPRIRGFSFPTRRPTVNELIRAFTELTRVKISHLSSTALAQLDADYLASITPAPAPVAPTPKAIAPKPTVIKLTREEELERDRWTRMVDMVKKGKVEALASFLDKYGPELEQSQVGGAPWGTLPAWMEESRTTPSLLHVASAADQADMVKWLLVEKRADPTLRPPIEPSTSTSTSGQTTPRLALTAPDHVTPSPAGRAPQTPYELAPSRATRNVFRLLTTQHPDWWDWMGAGVGGARVPSGLDEDKEEEREAKGRERRSKLRDKLKEREKGRAEKERAEKEQAEKEQAERKAREEAELKRTGGNRVTSTGPQRLGGGPPMRMQEAQMAGLTEEQKMRIERERRLRAIEARMGKQ